MSKGYVYILSNESMPGLVKIGKTTRSVEARANELFQTGVPTPFKVEEWHAALDCDEVERNAHAILAKHRVSESREFFRCHIWDAGQTVSSLVTHQVAKMVEEFAPDYRLIYEPDYPIPADIERLMTELDRCRWDICRALSGVTAEELRPSLERYDQKIDEIIAPDTEALRVVK